MERTSDDKKKLKSIVSALQKSVECPVCLETVKQPFKVCVRGHSACLECIKKLEKCPLCQELFTLENLVCLKNVLEALPDFCCYSDAGCEEVVEPGDDHEMFCGFRPIVCRKEECSVKMPLVKIIDHYKSNHSGTFVFTETTAPVFCNLNLFSHDEYEYTLVSLFNNIFWIYEVKDVTENLWKIFFQATPIGKLENKYYVRIEFKKEEMVYIHTLKAEVMSSCGTKLGGKQGEQPNEEYCMKIPLKELHNFLNDEGNHEYNFNFFEKKTANV